MHFSYLQGVWLISSNINVLLLWDQIHEKGFSSLSVTCQLLINSVQRNPIGLLPKWTETRDWWTAIIAKRQQFHLVSAIYCAFRWSSTEWTDSRYGFIEHIRKYDHGSPLFCSFLHCSNFLTRRTYSSFFCTQSEPMPRGSCTLFFSSLCASRSWLEKHSTRVNGL